jgi:hypothetical protein
MILPLNIAEKLKQMLDKVEIPSSKLKHAVITELIEDGVIQVRNIGKSQRMYYVNKPESLTAYIANHFGISSLKNYIEYQKNDTGTRSESVLISSDSKLKQVRTFKGFLVNCYQPIDALISEKSFIINPVEGTYTFIYDYEHFKVPAGVTIVGIENPENFKEIQKQKSLFNNISPLFVSRYPQNRDLVKWLGGIPNKYLHFGDYDFEGVNIYLNEYKKHLKDRASFFIPEHIENILKTNGNRELYNRQLERRPNEKQITEKEIIKLIALIDKYKKGLEQEIFINN